MNFIKIAPEIITRQISSREAFKVFGPCKTMYLGKIRANNIYRMLFKFPLSMIPEQCIILKAVLKLYVQSVGTYTNSIFTPFIIVQDWSVTTINWNNQPNFSPNISGESVSINRPNFYTFNITEMVQMWYENAIPNYGFIIKNNEIRNGTNKQITTVINSNLSPTVEIYYGLKTEIQPPSTIFIEKYEEMNTDELYRFSSVIDMSLTKTITYYIENIGDSDVEAVLQLSPDGIHFFDDAPVNTVIYPNELSYIIPYKFAKYGRLAVRNTQQGQTSTIRIWYQSQE
ncbi:MAG: DNRLRE domain-containing protein [Bacillota bacterium]